MDLQRFICFVSVTSSMLHIQCCLLKGKQQKLHRWHNSLFFVCVCVCVRACACVHACVCVWSWDDPVWLTGCSNPGSQSLTLTHTQIYKRNIGLFYLRTPINSLVCWFCTSTLGLILFQICFIWDLFLYCRLDCWCSTAHGRCCQMGCGWLDCSPYSRCEGTGGLWPSLVQADLVVCCCKTREYMSWSNYL